MYSDMVGNALEGMNTYLFLLGMKMSEHSLLFFNLFNAVTSHRFIGYLTQLCKLQMLIRHKQNCRMIFDGEIIGEEVVVLYTYVPF
jgi:hypothetical protein